MLPEAQASHRGVLPSMLRASTLWEEETSVRASVGVGGGTHVTRSLPLMHSHLCKGPS